MGLHDRLKTPNGSSFRQPRDLIDRRTEPIMRRRTPSPAQDPYAELKTRIHHACIATLGAELFKRESTSSGDLERTGHSERSRNSSCSTGHR